MNKLKINSKKLLLPFLAALLIGQTSCKDDLLDLTPTDQLAAPAFWKTQEDAIHALHGAYSDVRPLFDRDYYFDGQADYVRVRGNSGSTSGTLRLGAAYTYGNFKPTGYGSSFDDMFMFLYGGVHRTNYVIDNVKLMLPTATPANKKELEAIIGEARLLRGMVYFRLISLWGDVPYIGQRVYSNAEVATLARTPISQIKDSIMADFTYAYEKLPVQGAALGRAGKPAALAFRGKLQLYWASWNKFGWPELETFTPNAAAATAAYSGAAADFRSVINDFGLDLYMGGEPGEIDELGKADKLPNYYHLFTPKANLNNKEMIMVFTHGGVNTSQGEELMRDFAGRSHENSQCFVTPRYEIADRYQSTITGDFVEPLMPMEANAPGARTIPGSAVNPQSYANRDYRMKASIMWDYEMSMGMNSRQETGMVPFIFRQWGVKINIGGNEYTTYNTDGTNSGYVFRKFVRNNAGQTRSEGDFAWPVMRLADVYLMYAEATNEVSGPQADAIALVNKVRRRGNLPALAADKSSSKDAFFDAIEQERIIELVAEGHRNFDLRRWRALERVWGQPGGDGVRNYNTWGAQVEHNYQNTQERQYQQSYIFRIPPGERDRNPNLTQNFPWL